MFTGLIQDIGEITAIDRRGDWTLTIAVKKLPLDKIDLGASVACNGVCLTVVEKKSSQFKTQISMESLNKTTAKNWREGTKLNLECALRMGDELGGHLLSGHIDGIARVVDVRSEGDSRRYQFETPREFIKFLAPKGSIAIDGVSLTLNEVSGPRFGINIIPYTQQQTIFSDLKAGDEVNFEVDMIARYIERMLAQRMAS